MSTNNDRGNIFFITGEDISKGDQLRLMTDRWNEENPNQTVTFIEWSTAADDGRTQLAAAAQSGNGDCYDVVTLDVVWTAEFTKFGYVVPLDPADFDLGGHMAPTIDSAMFEDQL